MLKIKNLLLGNAAIYLLSQIANAAIPFLLLPILTRVLTPTDYGVIAMFGVVLSILGALTGLSVHGAVSVQYFRLSKEAFAQYVCTCLGILVLSTSIIFVLVGLFGIFLQELTGVPAQWLLVGVVLSGLQFVCSIRLTLWQVANQALPYGAFQVSQSLLNAAASLLLILVMGLSWSGRLWGQTVAMVAFALLAVVSLTRSGWVASTPHWRQHAKDALAFGLPLIPHTLGGIAIVAVDRFVIVKYRGLADAGLYMVAMQMGQVLGLLTESFNKAYAPWLMNRLANPHQLSKEKLVRGTYLYFVLVLGFAVVLGLLAPQILGVLVGPSFLQAAPLVIYIAVGFAFGGCYYMVTNYLFFEKKTLWLAVLTFAVGSLNIGLTVALVGQWGILGAAQAYAITQGMSFLGTWYLAQKAYPLPWLRSMINNRAQ